jgi:hypothetical protein
MRNVSAIGFVPLASLIVVSSVTSCAHSTDSSFAPEGSDASAFDAGAINGDADLVGDGNTSGRPCQGLGCQVVDCAAQGLPNTSLTGRVFDPAGQNPLYDVIVYVPNGPLQPLASGVTCDQCGVLASGNPLVTALTGADGKFKLDNVPVVPNLPLVIQLGKWRRQVVIPQITPCAENPADDPSKMRLPRNRSEGDMPQIAVSTGSCDPFECLLRKIGIDASEFTNEEGGGHVHLYQGVGGATLAQPTTPAATFWAGKSMPRYDIVINACECGEQPQEKPQSSVDNMVAYANAGGRVFDTHYQYYWIDPTKIQSVPPTASNPAWQSTATFIPEQTGSSDLYGYVDTTFPKGQAFAQWLLYVGASVEAGELTMEQARYNVTGVNPPSTRWVFNPNVGQTQTPESALLHYTFNTPVGAPASQQCGKVLFSDFHAVTSTAVSSTFPGECDGAPMSPQEKALEFMLFDLSACIQEDHQPPQPPPPSR